MMAAASTGLEAAPFFVMRTPLLPFSEWLDWSAGPYVGEGMSASSGVAAADRTLLWARLRDVLAHPIARQAMFFAAPRVEAELARLDGTGELPDDKLLRTLVRYFARMTGRTTPFGLFAGCSVGRVGHFSKLCIAGSASYRSFTTLDVGYLLGATESARRAAQPTKTLSVRANPSLYRVGDRLRFVEARTDADSFVRSYHLAAVEATEIIESVLVLAAEPVSLANLADRLCNLEAGLSFEEGFDFAVSLLQAQLLTDSLEPAVTGPEPLRDVTVRLAAVPDPKAKQLHRVLSDVEQQLRALDRNGLGTPSARYREMLPALSAAEATTDSDKVFQADLFKPAPQAALDARIAARICDAARLLARLMPPSASSSLSRFRDAFRERFEGCEVPLMEVLDPDVGIGFEPDGLPDEESSPWLAAMPWAEPSTQTVTWGPREAHLLRRVLDTVDAHAQVLELTDADVDALGQEPSPPLPPFCAVTATLAARSLDDIPDDDPIILLHGLFGASGAEFLGRFCHGDSELAALVANWLEREQQFYRGAVLAEIVHLPQGRTGNVVCRPVMRSHEVLCLAQSGVAIDGQIPLSDLTVKVEGTRVVLRSRKLGRDVVPRLTAAHYAKFADLVHYRFLWALHLQDAIEVSWQWGPLANVPFLPRVTYGRVVLDRATWRLDSSELTTIQPGTQDCLSRIQRLREKRRLPRHVLMVESDMALPLDLENVLCADVLAAEARRGPVRLVEQFPAAEELCATGPEGRFAHELIVPLRRTDGPAGAAVTERPRARSPGRPPAFTPGEQWLSASIFASHSTLDRRLATLVGSLIQHLRTTGAIEGWFFIRYWEPKPHLRLRLRGAPQRLREEVWPALQEAIKPCLDSGEIHAVRLDTYVQEVNRYGGPRAIAAAERFFEADSDMTLALLALDDHDMPDLRERVALMATDALLRAFGLDETGRETFATDSEAALMADMPLATGGDTVLGQRFRTLRSALTALVTDGSEETGGWPPAARDIITRRSAAASAYRDLCRRLDDEGALTTSVSDILGSLVHMQTNRLMRAAPRAVELVIYDLLRRLYRSERARRNQA
jgi:thiopeptide-type bacteriocin biosynthesis protein